MKTTQTQVTLALGIVAAGVGFYMLSRATKAGASAIEYGVQKLNPLSDQNIFYQAASQVGDLIGGGPSDSLGGRVYEAQTKAGLDWWTLTPIPAVSAVAGLANKLFSSGPPTNPAAPQVSVQSQLPDVVSNSNAGVNFNYF